MSGIWAETKDGILNSCKVIDINEQDADSLRDATAFGYYLGIRNEYAYTYADPYYYPSLKRRENLVRKDWKNKPISKTKT